ncbi:MAG: hypothetical protein AAFY08_09855 [Planctomycetota bacterium]
MRRRAVRPSVRRRRARNRYAGSTCLRSEAPPAGGADLDEQERLAWLGEAQRMLEVAARLTADAHELVVQLRDEPRVAVEAAKPEAMEVDVVARIGPAGQTPKPVERRAA